MVNNLEQIKKHLKFENEYDFYFIQILKRKKENPQLGSNSYVVKTYYIKSIESLDLYFPEMKLLADFHNARVCINLNKRNFQKCSLKTIKKILEQYENKDYISAPKAFNTVCGKHSSDNDKKWVIDYDEKDLDKLEEVKNFINTLQPKNVEDKIYDTLETKNGYHLITSSFNLKDFKDKYKDIEVHKNNPTIIYIP